MPLSVPPCADLDSRGIDIDIPTEPGNSKGTPQSVNDAVLAAFHAGAPGVILSRKYSEMRFAT